MISKFSKFVISINTSILLVCVPHVLFNLHYIAIITGIVWFILSSFEINNIWGHFDSLYRLLMNKGLGVVSQIYRNESKHVATKVTKKRLRQMNHEQLVVLAQKSNIILPLIGSGKNKKVLKKDIVNTLYNNLNKYGQVLL